MTLLTEEDPCDEGVSIIATLGAFDVTEADEIQLPLAPTTRRIDREQDGPGDQTAKEADGHRDLEVSKQKKSVEGLVVEDVAVRDLVEGSNPVEQAIWKGRRSFPRAGECESSKDCESDLLRTKRAKKSSGGVVALQSWSKTQEDGKVREGD